MKNKKLLQTHRHLTLVFTGVVFCIILLLGSIFLGIRHFSESRQEKIDFLRQVREIELLMLKQDNFFENFKRLEKFTEHRKFGDKNGGKNFRALDMNFIVIDDDRNIVFQNILKQPRFDSLDFSHDTFYIDEHTYVAIREVGKEKNAIFYKELRHDFSDLLRDVFVLFLLASFSGGVLYFIGNRFVEGALRPVERNLQDMTDFVHNAGHELKTPLAVMRGNLQVMEIEKKYDKKLLQKSIREIDSINSLIEGLIELSQVGKLSEKSSLALSVEVKKVVSELGDLAFSKKIKINNTVNGDFIVKANRQELYMLLINLVKNAITYNKKGGEVYISLDKNVLSIRDTGAGISGRNQEKIFERFFQVADVRNQEGFGIGLSLVKKITDANGWKINIESKIGKGSKFQIVF